MTYLETMQEMFYEERKGKVYGNWEVIKVEYDKERKKQLWTLRCVKCGREKQTYWGKDLAKGKNKGTCKCDVIERQRIRKEKEMEERRVRKATKIRATDHVLYSIWRGIKARCNNPNDKDYKNYGARGITMCEEWKNDFWKFVEWGEEAGYLRGLTIDRVDNNKGYSPDNCVWADRARQQKNKRNVKTFIGMTIPDLCKEQGLNNKLIYSQIKKGKSLSEAFNYAMTQKYENECRKKCKEHGIRYETVKRRMKEKGLSFEEAVSYKGKICKYYFEYNGERKSLNEWCKIYNITAPAVIYRMKKRGMSFEQALTAPKE